MLGLSVLMFLATGYSLINKNNSDQKSGAIETIFARKSVRSFLPEKIEDEKTELLLKAGMAAPSGKNIQPWEFIVIDDRATLDSMAKELPYAKWLEESPLAIIVCGDTLKSSYWYLDCSASAQNILLAAESLGLGAVWTAAYPYEERIDVVKKHINMPDNISPLCVIPIGYPSSPQTSKNKWDPTKTHRNKW
ncbi:MAG: nitroreductase family protein [Tannerellaceae bacterium]